MLKYVKALPRQTLRTEAVCTGTASERNQGAFTIFRTDSGDKEEKH